MLDEMQSLLKSPAWDRLANIVEEQARLRQNSILTTEEESITDLLSMARLKAERQGMLLVINLPQTIITNLKEELKREVEETAQTDE